MKEALLWATLSSQTIASIDSECLFINTCKTTAIDSHYLAVTARSQAVVMSPPGWCINTSDGLDISFDPRIQQVKYALPLRLQNLVDEYLHPLLSFVISS